MQQPGAYRARLSFQTLDGSWRVDAPEVEFELRPRSGPGPPKESLLIRGASPPEALALSPDSRWLATGSATGRIACWDLATGLRHQVLVEGAVQQLGFASAHHLAALVMGPDRKHRVVLLAVEDRRILWERQARPGLLQVGGGTVRAGSLAWTVDTRIPLAEPKKEPFITYLPGGARAFFREGARPVDLPSHNVALHGHLVAVGEESGEVSLWDLQARRRLDRVDDNSPRTAVAFSPEGLLVTSIRPGLGFWSPDKRELVGVIPLPLDEASSITLSADGRLVAAAIRWEGTIHLADRRSKRLLCTLGQVGTGDDWFAVAPDGRYEGTPAGLQCLRWANECNRTDVPLTQARPRLVAPGVFRVMGPDRS